MKVFYSKAHELHCPETFFLQGEFLRFTPDPPARAKNILSTIEALGHDVIEPEDYGLTPVAAVHSPEYIDYLQTVWREWHALGATLPVPELRGDSRDVYPLIFPVAGVQGAYPKSILGRAGFHSSDLWMPIGEYSWEAIVASANLAVAAAESVLSGDGVSYALCRPSGHHADRHRGGGNCYLNNAAIAAQHLRQRLARVAIVDIDVHHGNGTQQIFYQRDDVLFVSIHSHPEDCYPYFVGYEHERGEGRGMGFNFNLPVAKGSGDEAFLEAIDTAVKRVTAFAADALVISLGVDGHEHDATQELKLTHAGFERAASELKRLGLPTVLVQEGGYNLDTIGDCVASVLKGF